MTLPNSLKVKDSVSLIAKTQHLVQRLLEGREQRVKQPSSAKADNTGGLAAWQALSPAGRWAEKEAEMTIAHKLA